MSAVRTEDTSRWIWSTAYFQDWFHGLNNVLMLVGGPGVDKTVLTCSIIDYLQSNMTGQAQSALAYIFLDDKEKKEQSYEVIVASLAKQLAPQNESNYKLLKALHDKKQSGYVTPGAVTQQSCTVDPPSRNDSDTLLLKIANTLDKLYLVVDAFDESNPQSNVSRDLSVLLRLLQNTSCQVNILITSRFEVSPIMALRDARVKTITA